GRRLDCARRAAAGNLRGRRLPQPSSCPPPMIRLACSTASFPQEPVARALARVAWAGFEAVELALPAEPLEGIDREDLKARLRANDLDLAAVEAGRLGARSAEDALEAAGRIGRAVLLAREPD